MAFFSIEKAADDLITLPAAVFQGIPLDSGVISFPPSLLCGNPTVANALSPLVSCPFAFDVSVKNILRQLAVAQGANWAGFI